MKLKSIIFLVCISICAMSFGTEPSYENQLSQFFKEAGMINKSQLIEFLENESIKCQTPSGTYEFRDIEVTVKRFHIGGNSPLFPRKDYTVILTPQERGMNYLDAELVQITETVSEEGFTSESERRYSSGKETTYTTKYRKKDSFIFFENHIGKKIADCDSDDISHCTWDYTNYGYCYLDN